MLLLPVPAWAVAISTIEVGSRLLKSLVKVLEVQANLLPSDYSVMERGFTTPLYLCLYFRANKQACLEQWSVCLEHWRNRFRRSRQVALGLTTCLELRLERKTALA